MLNEVYINQIIEKGYVEKFKKGKYIIKGSFVDLKLLIFYN